MHNSIRLARRFAVGVLGGVRIGGRVLEAHEHPDLDAERLLVEFERFLGAAVEEQVNLRLHQYLPFALEYRLRLQLTFLRRYLLSDRLMVVDRGAFAEI